MSEQTRGVALVTGANRGIGREVARQLGERGYDVLLGARDPEKAAAAARELEQSTGASIRPLTLDVADPASIAAAAESVHRDPGRLDVLVNNAGIGGGFGVAGVDPDFDAIQRALDTNFFGAYRLTVALLDLLRRSERPRIVNVSSGMGGVAEMGGWSLKDDGFLVNSACPGFVNTDMGGPMGAQKPVEDGAAGVVWLATLPDGGPTGGFFRDGKPVAF